MSPLSHRQWHNKVAVGPRASIPKGPPLPQKNSVGQILGPPQRWARVPCTPYCYATAHRDRRPCPLVLITINSEMLSRYFDSVTCELLDAI